MQHSTKLTLAGLEDYLAIFGANEKNIPIIEDGLQVQLLLRGGEVQIQGSIENIEMAQAVILKLADLVKQKAQVDRTTLRYALGLVLRGQLDELEHIVHDVVAVTYRGRAIRCKTLGQQDYVKAINQSELTFGIGPAGTGKTYLAMALAVVALRNKDVQRIILTRPAVEAGEKLGFLPGDLTQKVDPYLRPLFDALHEMMGAESYQRLTEKGALEIAPLAYMRGRTLSDSFIILDEAQNTTPEQMKMFLTRLGSGSKAVVTGDPSQTDLIYGRQSGLTHAAEILKDIPEIKQIYLNETDIVRHDLVQSIVRAYDKQGRKENAHVKEIQQRN